MDKQMMIVLLVIVVLVVGVIMYQGSQQADKDRQLQLQLASMQQGGSSAPTNFWDSIGDWGTLFGGIGGLFGGDGSSNDAGDTMAGGDGEDWEGNMALASYGSPNSDASIGVPQGLAAINGMENGLMYAEMVDNPYDNFNY